MIQKIDKETAEKSTPQFNKSNPKRVKSILRNKMIFRDTVVLLPQSSFRVSPDIKLNGSDSMG